MADLRDELRRRYPGLGKRADHQNSRAAAIDLFCRECMGGSRADVVACPARKCFLWPFRPGVENGADRPVPTEDEYAAMTADKPDPVWMRGGGDSDDK